MQKQTKEEIATRIEFERKQHLIQNLPHWIESFVGACDYLERTRAQVLNAVQVLEGFGEDMSEVRRLVEN